MENFKFFGSIYDMKKETLLKRIKELSDLFEINEYINQINVFIYQVHEFIHYS